MVPRLGVFILPPLLGALLVLGCGDKPAAHGSAGGLVVIADEADRSAIQPLLTGSFSRVIYTPQPESLFRISWTSADSLKLHIRSPLLLLAATLDGGGGASRLLRSMTTPEIEVGIRSGDLALFSRRDPWARGQWLLILAAPDGATLAWRARRWEDSLHTWAVTATLQRLKEPLRREGLSTKEKRLSEEYHFTLEMENGFKLVEANDSSGYIRWHLPKPSRWLTVAWGALPEPKRRTAQFLYERCKAMREAFSEPVVIYDDRWEWEEADINGLPAIKIRGLWAGLEPVGGGPFFCYGLWNLSDQRYYIIDGAVFAPGEAKMPYLWQLEAQAQTFIPPDSQEK